MDFELFEDLDDLESEIVETRLPVHDPLPVRQLLASELRRPARIWALRSALDYADLCLESASDRLVLSTEVMSDSISRRVSSTQESSRKSKSLPSHISYASKAKGSCLSWFLMPYAK